MFMAHHDQQLDHTADHVLEDLDWINSKSSILDLVFRHWRILLPGVLERSRKLHHQISLYCHLQTSLASGRRRCSGVSVPVKLCSWLDVFNGQLLHQCQLLDRDKISRPTGRACCIFSSADLVKHSNLPST